MEEQDGVQEEKEEQAASAVDPFLQVLNYLTIIR